MDERHVRYEIANRAVVLTIDRPAARNALSEQAIREIGERHRTGERDRSALFE